MDPFQVFHFFCRIDLEIITPRLFENTESVALKVQLGNMCDPAYFRFSFWIPEERD